MSGSAAEILKTAGVKSLYATALKAQRSVTGLRGYDEPKFMQVISDFLSPAMRNISKRLSKIEFPDRHLRANWREQLRGIKCVRLAKEVVASYLLRGTSYSFSSSGEVDEGLGILWLRDDFAESANDAFFELLASRIFDAAPRYAGAILQTITRVTYQEAAHIGDFDEEEFLEDDTVMSVVAGDQRPVRHGRAREMPSNLPRPRAITRELTERAVAEITERATKKGGVRERSFVPLEVQQIEELKAFLYAWNCQACLAREQPQELAPARSYVADSRNRKRVIEAHHIDHVVDGGARDVSNIVLLCYAHHQTFGDELNRSQILRSLRDANQRVKREFISEVAGSVGAVSLDGFIVEMATMSGSPVSLFFALDHRDYWLDSADAPQAMDGQGALPSSVP